MLQRVKNQDGTINVTGMLQAWVMIYALYKGRDDVLDALPNPADGEAKKAKILYEIGGVSAPLVVYQAAQSFFVAMSPVLELDVYLTWMLGGTPAVFDASVHGWVNTLWSGYAMDVRSQILSLVNFIGPGGKVQLAGHSMSGATTKLIARYLGFAPNNLPVDHVGFGMPRVLTNSIEAGPEQSTRIDNEGDTIPLIPLPLSIRLTGQGGPDNFPPPVQWIKDGFPVQLHTSPPYASTQPDPPFVPGLTVPAEVLAGIQYHTPAAYALALAAISGSMEETALGPAGVQARSLLLSLINDGPVLPTGLAQPPIIPSSPLPTTTPDTGFITPFGTPAGQDNPDTNPAGGHSTIFATIDP